VATVSEAEEAVAELLEGNFGQPACSYTDVESRRTTVAVYLPKTPLQWQRKQSTLREGIERIRACGLSTGTVKISLTRVARENWAHSWKLHFRPQEISAQLLIKPSWSRRRPRKGQVAVVLDPGLSFGTGRHPTTAYCLRQLAKWHRIGAAQSFLDLGTGSGILAIAAARLGYRPVEGWDWDAEALRTALANARRNYVANRIRLTRRDVSRLPRKCVRRYSVVCANLDATLLVAHRDRLIGLLRDDGILVLAGIMLPEFASVRRAYEKAGLRLIGSRVEKRWRSGTFER
jgi:ribosomal protein L11 methyltransferase